MALENGPLEKEIFYSKPSFLGSMLSFAGVYGLKDVKGTWTSRKWIHFDA